MSQHNRLLAVSMALALAAGLGTCGTAQAQAKAQKKVYCWNESGRKICSDALPAEAANSARTEISAKSGLATGQVARALTDSERTAAAASAVIARRQAEANAIQERRDLAMVESYVTEGDLRRAYGERTSLLDETLKASQLGLSNLRLSLITLLRQAGDWELDKKPVPKRLANSILQAAQRPASPAADPGRPATGSRHPGRRTGRCRAPLSRPQGFGIRRCGGQSGRTDLASERLTNPGLAVRSLADQ